MRVSSALIATAGAIALLCCTVPATAQNNASEGTVSAPEHCAAILQTDFSKLIDAPTQVEDAKVIDASADGPAYCQVLGYVSPNVGFKLFLPISNWNGKFLEVGCGGFCGTTEWEFWCPLDRGYACINSDLGHRATRGGEWGYNNLQAQIDFGYRGAHVASLAGKAIIEYYYKKGPSKSYFHGCSSGGQQALSEAQRYPWDFDGILVGAPSPTFAGPMMNFAWAKLALKGREDKSLFTRAEMEFVHAAAVKRCAVGDGLKHGFIDDPRNCKFDPAELLCRAGKQTQCLSDAQVQAIKKVYAGPTNSNGEKIYNGGAMPGSELNWIDGEVDTYVSSTGEDNWPEEYFGYIGFWPAPGPGWKYTDFDFDRDYKRMETTDAIFGAANDPDLRKFKAAGGKMILYQGWADQSDPPMDAVDYYETTEKTMGGRGPTQEFFRMFMVPGMHHCSGGAGPFAIDYLTYLEAWVEQDHAPDKMIGAHVTGTNWVQSFRLRFPLKPGTPISFTRPVYPYPLSAKYKGSGDPDDAANFVPVGPQR